MLLSYLNGLIGAGGRLPYSCLNQKAKFTQRLLSGLILTLGSGMVDAGSLSVKSGATLYGTGGITTGNTSVEAGAFIAPGASPGCLATANLTLANGSQFNAEIEGSTVCSQYDRVSVTGTVSLNSATLNTSVNGYSLQGGDRFTLINNDATDAISGTFSGLAEGGIFSLAGKNISVSYVAGDGNDVVLTVLADQLITFNGLVNKVYGESSFALSASASSGLSVTFSSTTPAVCSLGGSTLSLVGTGSCSITASQAGNANYSAAANVVQNFIVTDQSSPVIVLNGNSSITVAVGSTYSDAGATATDNVDGDISANIAVVNPVDANTVGSYIVAYNVSDDAGNAATQVTRLVNVTDQTAPVITVLGLNPQNIEVGDAYSELGATAADNIDGDISGSMVIDASAVDTNTVGAYTATYNVQDAAGNNAVEVTRTVNITADVTIPVISLTGANPQIIEVGNSYGELGATAADNIDGNISASIVIDSSALNVNAVGSFNVTYNVSDTSANAAVTMTRQVTVQDTTAPVVTAPANITVAAINANGTANTNGTINGFLAAASGSDNLDGSVTVTHDGPGIFPLGTTTVTFSATDAAGNTGTKQANVTITDQSAPVISLNGNSAITLNVGDSHSEAGATATDNVDGDVSANIQLSGSVDTGTVGSYTLTYRVSDAAGNSATAVTRIITVQDVIAPVLVAPANITVAATNASGTLKTQSAIASFLAAATASDNVDGVVTGITQNAPAIFPLGITTVTFSATDAAGNTGIVQATVTIRDQSAPVLSLLGNAALTINVGTVYTDAGATASDNVDGNLTSNIAVTGTVDTSTPGLYSLSFSVSDAAGNAATTVTRSVTVQDAFVPVVTPAANITVAALDANGLAAADAAIQAFLNGATAVDDVDGNIALISNDAPATFPLGVTVVTFSAVDNAGNTGQAQASVTVSDQAKPVINLTGAASMTLAVGATFIEPGASASDNVDGDLSASINITGTVNTGAVGIYNLSYNVSDAAGNAAITLQRQVSVQDAAAPVVTPMSSITVAATDQNGTSATDTAIAAFLNGASANDGVDGVITVTNNAPITFPLGVTIVTFSATDTAGNTGNAQASVSVSDQTAPVITLSGNTSITLGLGATYSDAGASSTDNVDGDISANVVLSGTVNTSTLGSYNLIYNVVDTAGNAAASVTRTITVIDQTIPVISLLGDAALTVAQGSVYNDAGATALDNSDGDISIAIVTTGSVNTNTVGSYILSYNVADIAGNAALTVIRTVTVTDQTDPVISLLGDTSLTVAQGSVYADAGATALDNNDGDISITILTTGAVDTSALGVYSVKFDVVDAAGNAATSVTRIITVTDQSAPVITLLGDAALTVAQGSAYADAGATALDNNDGDISGNITVSGSVDTSVVGVYVLSYVVTDAGGNTATTFTRTVTVSDQTAPVVSVPTSIELAAIDSQGVSASDAAIVAFLAGASATDNVDGAITNLTNNAPASFPLGDTTVTFSATDAAGNTNSAQASITVTDQTNPVVTAPFAITVAASDASGTNALNSNIALFLASATASDNVDGVVTGVSHDAPATLPLGETSVIFSATDAAGNTGTATASVTIVDQTAPVVTLLGSAAITVEVGTVYSDAGATARDNVDGEINSDVVASGAVDTSTPGLYTITYDVSDAAGNAAITLTRSITVQDVFVPVVTPPANITLAAIDANGIGAINGQVQAFLNGATAIDDVDGNIDAITHDAPATLPIGLTTVTFSAMDSAGNTGQAQASVTVTDQTAPVINLNGSVSITLAVGESFSEPGAAVMDNVDGDISGNIVISGTVDSNAVGIYLLNYDITDAAGNAANTVQRQVSVQDAAAPVVTPPLSITVAATDQDGTDASDVTIDVFLFSATANDSVEGDISVNNDAPFIFPLGVTTVTFSATDSAGNTGSAQATVTITDQDVPVITLIGDASIILNVGDSYGEEGATALDNIDGDLSNNIVVTGNTDTNAVGNYIITYVVTDAAGNESIISRNISVQDVSAPMLTAPADIVVSSLGATGVPVTQQEIVDFLSGAMAMDDIDGEIFNITHDAPAVFPLGLTIVTFSATDSADNAGFVIASVSVIDVFVPVIILNGESTLHLGLNETYVEPGANATDNVDGDISSQVVIANNVNSSTPGTYEVSYSVTDSSGNNTITSRTVVVEAEDTAEETSGIGPLNVWYLLLVFSLLTQREYKFKN